MGKGRGPESKDDEHALDPRHQWIMKRVGVAFRMKHQELRKAFEPDGDNSLATKEFCDTADSAVLYVLQKGSQVVVQTEPPNEGDSKQKRKVMYFMKLTEKGKYPKIDYQTMHKTVVFGDLSTQPLETLNHYCKTVFLPMVKVPFNISEVNAVARPALMESAHNYSSQVLVTSGLAEGRTLLPMPRLVLPARVDRPVRDKDLLYLLESVIVKWTVQVKSAVSVTPENMTLPSGQPPGPLEELQFWRSKRDNLLNLQAQLHTPGVVKVRTMLAKAQSSYHKSFSELLVELRSATEEAADNHRFLEPLREDFIRVLDATDDESFAKLLSENVFDLLFQHMLTMWLHSAHYNTPVRLVILIREVCNDLIRSAVENASVEDLFTCECDEAVKKLSAILLVCGQFKSAYFKYKTKAATEGSGDRPPVPWKFQNTSLFWRLDSFLERCHDVLDALETTILFNRLDRVEIGGTKGAEQSAHIASVHREFLAAYEEFHSPTEYPAKNLLDVDEPRFDLSFHAFRQKVKRMEMQVGAILAQSIEDTKSLQSVFKLVDTYEGFIERTIIQQEWHRMQGGVLQAYRDDLLTVQELFRKQKDTIANQPVYYSMPPTVAQLAWARGLLERITEPFARLCDACRNLSNTELYIETVKLNENLSSGIRSFVSDCYEGWSTQVGKVSSEKLKLNLLCIDDKKRVAVNFDSELEKLLKDINYLQILNSYEQAGEKFVIPPHALVLFKRRDLLRSQRLKLDFIATTYNQFMETMLPVEMPLLAAELQDFEDELMRGVTRLSWNSAEVDDFIEVATRSVNSLDGVLKATAQNVKKIVSLLTEFAADDKFLPVHPKETKTLLVDEFIKKYADHKQMQQQALTGIGREIHELIAHSLECVNGIKARQGLVLLDSDTECWVNYVEYANDIVLSHLTAAIVHSIDNLRKQLSADWLRENDGIPLLDIKLLLTTADPYDPVPKAKFAPNLQAADGHGALDTLVNEWIKDYTNMACFVTRLDSLPGSDGSYGGDVRAKPGVLTLQRTINDLLAENAQACQRYEEQFLAYRGLWEDDMQKVFKEFMQGEAARAGRDAKAGDGGEAAVDFFGVPLELFEQKIGHYEKLLSTVTELPPCTTVGWLRVDSKPIRESLKDCCKKWISLYTGYIVERIDTSLRELTDFMAQADEGLDEDVCPGEEGETDEAALRRVLKHIRGCKRRDTSIKAMFDPISDGIQVLRSRSDGVDEKTLQSLEDLRVSAPDQWKDLDKKYRTVRKVNNERQEQHGDRLKYQALSMEEEVLVFRTNFKNLRPFHYSGISVEQAYEELVTWNAHLLEREQQAKELNELLDLFEKQTTDLPELKECRHELILLKQLWDMVSHVKSQFSDWWAQTFKTMDAEELIAKTKDMLKQMKAMPLKCKATNTFVGLEDEIKSMLITLPLVENLRNPAMRERHWKQLLQKCEVPAGSVDPESELFSLQDLLSLQLHRFEEDVADIVEKAQKELQIEKGLEKVVHYWDAEARFTYEYHQSLGCFLLNPIDDIVEVLEEHLNALQAMQTNRYVEEFAEQVNSWQRSLSVVETCVSKWIDLQKMWKNLYPIFIESADIRSQLQQDARAFDGANELYRAMMDTAHKYTSVLDVCCSDVIKKDLGREDDFETLLTTVDDTLVACQKKLREYLEGKKKLFARFFFLSDTDLVDILSKGSDPVAVMKHMSKMIDSVRCFNFTPDTKLAVEMVSIQGEKVETSVSYECSGPVEEWLKGCVDLMFMTMKASILDGYTTYVESPRIEWVMKKGYPCQTIVVASRIWFTSECEQAFSQLEDGNETALKEFLKQQHTQISGLIQLVLSQLTKNERGMLVHLITIDVHARDVVGWMIEERAENRDTFTWQSQLRYSWDDKRGSVIDICDASFINGYEYIGICGCLVITKLTDRCYITLSQALRLVKGGAPAGPAGTGKTETTKDLARNLGVACYVFNCSDQMDYLSLGQIFKGLSMSGSWGCFDEFNRIPIQVLSVVATQVGSILNALKLHKTVFNFMDEEISLIPKVGMWITMNPGYAGRTELPENIKSLFRPCAMCVPDLKNICEIMLAAEGFQDAKDLALKFVTLYKLNKELLSPQAHYDWGLRAVKSVLYIAGALKRGDPEVPERAVLMRALRDTNMAKLSRDDVFVFLGLIRALFPNLEVPPKVRPDLNDACKQACADRSLLRGENDIFVLRCVQFAELLDVRHSVFVMGPAGCGKSQCWQTLARAFKILGNNTDYRVMNPKAVTSDELYGYIHPQTREWKDGLLSNVFREFAEQSQTKENSKWIVLDGIIDAEWIESMNTVMDDNRMLTLASNERIPLTASMRMIFEISDLKNASPATVSRAGIVFINDTDLGWQPFKDRWIASRDDDKERTCLDGFFDKYIPPVIEWYKRVMKPPVAIVDLAIVQTVSYLLEGLCTPEHVPPGAPSEVYEKYFLFACIWAFGGPLSADGRIDYRMSFNNWWKKEWPAVKIEDPTVPADRQTVFDVFLDGGEFKLWSAVVKTYRHDPERPYSDVSIQTVDTTRLSFIMDLLTSRRRAVIFVGTAGTGKSNICLNYLRKMDQTQCLYQLIAFNAMTTPKGLQMVMEQKLEKKAGKMFGPSGKKRLVFFIDDINMPTPDKYGTQEAIAFLRQHVDYQFWYDRSKQGFPLKEIDKCQYVAAMNPKSGTFTILDRLLRHFAMLTCSLPDESDLMLIYGSILKGHLASWSRPSVGMAERLTTASIRLHKMISKMFLPTAIKFHYQWNLREMYNVFQGLTNTVRSEHDHPNSLVRLWLHEVSRTFRDRMTNEKDLLMYDDIVVQLLRDKSVLGDDVSMEEVLIEPNIWAPFGMDKDGNEGVVKDMMTFNDVFKFLSGKLEEYNDTHATMNLVLFEDAMQHICRICRIIANPRGNALLVGVGGSGKQSLSRLASSICGYEQFQIVVTASYGIPNFREDLQLLYHKCGQKNQQYAFVMTDSQVVVKTMLVYLNDLLNSGNIPDLFPQEDMESIQGSMLNEAKAAGVQELTTSVLWDFFINKVRANLHTILCFSPVGQQFATWCREFPALANTTVIDWFHPWPQQALISVAMRFLSDVDLGESTEAISEHMAFCHERVTEKVHQFFSEEKRYCYTTPKSFLELIAFYKSLLARKRTALNTNKERLINGIEKIKMASEQVAELQEKLKKEQIVVGQKAEVSQKLMVHVEREKEVVKGEQERAEVEEAKTNVVFQESAQLQQDCEKDLDAAQPIVQEALEALDSLNKNDLTEMKAFGQPPSDVVLVACAVMCLTADPRRIPIRKARDWANCKKMMANINSWLKDLREYDANAIPQPCIDAITEYVTHPDFKPHLVKTKSKAASGLCAWVVNMHKYHLIRCEVKPKEEKLAEAQERLSRAKIELKKVQDRVAELNSKLATLVKQFDEAVADTREIEAKAQKTQEKANLAERLVSGLASEKSRWAQTIEELEIKSQLLIGDVLLAAAFVSYIGPFTKSYREAIMEKEWRPDISERKIPHTPDLDVVMKILTSDAEVAGWQNEELKSDRLSTENGSIVVNCTRWPLLIDPQLQGVKWIKTREKERLQVCQTTQKGYINVVIKCLSEGLPCLIEKLGEQLDPILEPILGRMIIKRDSRYTIKLGDKECAYDPNFKLYLQTRLSNPHYKPELNAQATLINFMVTPEGLEDQLLAVVVNKERPDLEESRVTLIRRINMMTIELESCEENLLAALAAATGDILENQTLVENLEVTKKKAAEISKSMVEAHEMQAAISLSRKTYTSVAVRGSLLFFQIDQLAKISHMYQYSLGAYMAIFVKAILRAPQPEDASDLQARCDSLTDSITKTIFAFCSRGLFERHKLIFSALLCFAILQKEGVIDRVQLNYLLRGPKKFGIERPESVETWLPEANWAAVLALKDVDGTNPPFSQLEKDLEESNRWQKWCELERPEDKDEGRLPTDWKNLTSFQKLLVLRALRPDRLTVGLTNFVSDAIGTYFVEDKAVPLGVSFEDSGPAIPVFFILSAGVDPVQFVVALGKQFGMTEEGQKLFNVSLGQGQEPRAFHSLEHCFKNGGWAMLNNIHLVESFCKDLEKRLDDYEEVYTKMATFEKLRREKRLAAKMAAAADKKPSDDEDNPPVPPAPASELNEDEKPETELEDQPPSSEADAVDDDYEDDMVWEGPTGDTSFRVFLSAEPSPTIPIGILQRSIKLTNEPPSGIRANMVRALANFVSEPWENSQKPTEYKAVVYAMCFFHAVVVERKKFGPQGWNRVYPFNAGDLSTCIEVFFNYEERPRIPWDDLRYVFGEIMYGGHITDDWDRVLCMAYLQNFIHAGITEELELAPGLVIPSFNNYKEAHDSMKENVPNESPLLYGLHANAEIGFRTQQADVLFQTINELQPKHDGAAGIDPADDVKIKLDEFMSNLPDQHNLQDISERLDEDRTPQAHVFYQECERANILRERVFQSLAELDLGLKGALSMSTAMIDLFDCIHGDSVSASWAKVSFMSMRALGSWFANFSERNTQLSEWTGELQTPKVTMLNLLFNPMSFLTAIMQDTAIRNNFDLDQMALLSDVIKKWPDQIEYPSKDGAYVCGMQMEGARWDTGQGSIEESHLKELYSRIPVTTIRSLPVSKVDRRDQYECPLYKTQQRGPGIVTGLWLRTKAPARKWTVAGVALILDVAD
ncbi:Dynein beta chain [Diplonema papillatum]|nr:Dynein beta chain [Diplonema papillatum]